MLDHQRVTCPKDPSCRSFSLTHPLPGAEEEGEERLVLFKEASANIASNGPLMDLNTCAVWRSDIQCNINLFGLFIGTDCVFNGILYFDGI